MTIWEAAFAVIAGMLANELFAWQPRLARWLLEKAVKRTPNAMQDRLREEWQADLAMIPGKLSGVVFAASLLWQARRIEEYAKPRNLLGPCIVHMGRIKSLELTVEAIGPVLGEAKIAKPLLKASYWVMKKSLLGLKTDRGSVLDRTLLATNGYLLARYTKRLRKRRRDC